MAQNYSNWGSGGGGQFLQTIIKIMGVGGGGWGVI